MNVQVKEIPHKVSRRSLVHAYVIEAFSERSGNYKLKGLYDANSHFMCTWR